MHFLGPGGNMTFPIWCLQLTQLSNGRVIFRFPLDPGDMWHDRFGAAHPPPAKPPHMAAVNLMQEVMVNSSRLHNLSYR